MDPLTEAVIRHENKRSKVNDIIRKLSTADETFKAGSGFDVYSTIDYLKPDDIEFLLGDKYIQNENIAAVVDSNFSFSRKGKIYLLNFSNITFDILSGALFTSAIALYLTSNQFHPRPITEDLAELSILGGFAIATYVIGYQLNASMHPNTNSITKNPFTGSIEFLKKEIEKYDKK